MSSKLHEYLALLRPDEQKRFRRFLRSPYHNRQPLLAQLFDLQAWHLFQEPPRPLPEEEAAGHLFPGEPFDQNRYRKLGTALLQALREFFAAEALREDRPRAELYLLRRLNARQAERFIPAQIDRARQAVREAGLSREEASEHAVAIGLETYEFEARQAERHPRTQPETLLEELENGYRLRRIKLLYLQLNHLGITGQGQEPRAEEFVQQLELHWAGLSLEAKLYTLLYRCRENPDRIDKYQVLRSLLSERTEDLLRDEARDIYAGALNFCTQRVNRGDGSFLREMWNIYVEMQKKGFLERRGGVLRAHLKNIVNISARLGEFAWAEELLESLEDQEQGGELSPGLLFGRGVLEYYQGRPGQSERYFHRILDNFEDIFYGLDARVFLLRIYYETNNLVGLESLCESFRMYLKRSKAVPRSRKANYNHFVNYMRRLGRIPPFEKERLEKLHRDILEGRAISARDWLLEKVEGLLRR